ncbi:MAG: NOP5/NOP56 family protein [Haloarculaceae archaeon]
MDEGWFAGLDPDETAAAAERVRSGTAAGPADWPSRAVEAGFAADTGEYYDLLGEATRAATRAAVAEREGSDDRQLVHALRAMDDCRAAANELAERVAEWAGSRDEDPGTGLAYARELADREPRDRVDRAVVELASQAVGLDAEADRLRALVEQIAPEVAPNLAALAGPVLAARLISLAGDLESLARQPSGTVQVLGAEDALFAHLQGDAPSPKHGVIYTHEYVRHTHPDERGSAARALAGKLSIAARVDHYSGTRRPELDTELAARIERIRARGPQ